VDSIPIPLEAPKSDEAHVSSLRDALDTERRLLDELRRVLVAQRDGISADDLDALDASVFAANRLFRTLHEARTRRRRLLQLIGADEGARLADLETLLGGDVTPEIVGSRDDLLASAATLARELSVNRRLIEGVMAVGDELLRVFTGAEGRTPMYADGEEPASGGPAGALINTRV